MRLLADSHLLMWSAVEPRRLSGAARAMLLAPDNTPTFSVISLWELGIKRAKRAAGFEVDPRELRDVLFSNGWEEMAVAAEHALFAPTLPPIHGDPFDRMLVAQATVESALLLTSDAVVARYPGPVRLV